jgi:hypothetical protein
MVIPGRSHGTLGYRPRTPEGIIPRINMTTGLSRHYTEKWLQVGQATTMNYELIL